MVRVIGGPLVCLVLVSLAVDTKNKMEFRVVRTEADMSSVVYGSG